jgi:hypothetical protein
VTQPASKGVTTVIGTIQASSPPVAPWLDALQVALVGSSTEEGIPVSQNSASSASQIQQAWGNSVAPLQTSSTSLDGKALLFQEMQDTIKACSTGTCNCHIHPVNEKSYCGGKGSICGEEPSQKDADSYDPRGQYKFSQCFGDCFSKATSYNSLARNCDAHTGSE